jgi:NSS family neurotransmitter:Na+ symporter
MKIKNSKSRELWLSKAGFVFAAAGSAIGLGNLWRFPYVTGMYGGGAFVLIYLLSIIAIGMPIMIAEFIIGRRTQRNPVGAFAKLGKKKRWQLVGWLGLATGFILLSYYSVVGGWILDYVLKSAGGLFHGKSPAEINQMFDMVLKSPLRQVFFHALFLSLVTYIVSRGINKGIELWNKILMPLLFGILLLLMVNSLFSSGVREGMRFLFYPDFSKITATAILEAMGQAFFSLSLGLGTMITYGSYLKRDVSLINSATEICVLDTLVALVAGIVIFPIVFTYGLAPSAGPGLFFKTLPVVFSVLPGGRLIAFLFFLIVAFAALTSAISLLELVVAYFIDERKWRRKKAAIIMGLTIFLFGVPSALSFNTLKDLTLIKGINIFNFLDLLVTNYMLPAGGLLIAVFCGWFLSRKESLDEIRMGGNDLFFYRVWRFIIRYIAPVAVLFVFSWKAGVIAL